MSPSELIELFRVPHPVMKNVYVLGAFAKRVTLYSQQVRALNLIYALRETGGLADGCKVCVVGAGAAGLTAAAAAASFKAEVTLLECLQGPMELQRSSRIRWIDPFIYDWPVTENDGIRANLPFLDWEAGYGEKVAEQIEARWNAFVESPAYKIRTIRDLDKERLSFSPFGGKTWVSAIGRLNNEKYTMIAGFDVVILAVGFGVESERGARSSYWSDDNLDGGFMSDRRDQHWLISGCGDGGLTDLMRLCIHRFRHERVTDMFSNVKSMDAVKERLIKAHTVDLPSMKTLEEQEDFLAACFTEIADRYDLMPKFNQILRPANMPTMTLSGTGPTPYGPNSSLLNQLIVCQLQRHGAFGYIRGKSTIERTFSEDNFLKRNVRFHSGELHTFHRVIERHGPKRAIEAACFDLFKGALEELRMRWDAIFVAGDETREKQWSPDYFGATTVAKTYMRERSISKEVDTAGGSTSRYYFDNLSVIFGSLHRIRLTFASVSGIIGEFRLDAEAERLGIVWQADERSPEAGDLKDRLESMRRLNGYLVFQEPLLVGSNVNLSFSFRIFNGDALSTWEFNQMYASDQRSHINGEPLETETEYLARIIWFPVEVLKIRVTLPNRVSTPPFLSVFQYHDPESIPRSLILDKSHTLHICPPSHSPFNPDPPNTDSAWLRVEDPLLAEEGMARLANTAAQTWELTVAKPLIGTCYSFDWRLDNATPGLNDLADEASLIRYELLDFRAGGIGDAADKILACFQDLRSDLLELLQPERLADFEISLMTYDESTRCLVPVACMLGNQDVLNELEEIAIPFGLGLAGSAFKETEMIFQVPEPVDLFPFYIKFPQWPLHRFLLCAPLDHPLVSFRISNRSRYCFGVISVGTFAEESTVKRAPSLDKEIGAICERCSQRLYKALGTRWAVS